MPFLEIKITDTLSAELEEKYYWFNEKEYEVDYPRAWLVYNNKERMVNPMRLLMALDRRLGENWRNTAYIL